MKGCFFLVDQDLKELRGSLVYVLCQTSLDDFCLGWGRRRRGGSAYLLGLNLNYAYLLQAHQRYRGNFGFSFACEVAIFFLLYAPPFVHIAE